MQIYVNVYDFLSINPTLQRLGIGVYHTGVEINNEQYCYCVNDTDPTSSGVVIIQPQSADYIFSRKVYVGITNCGMDQLARIIYEMSLQFTCGQYNVFSNNCNHFSNELINRVSGKTLPINVFRLTDCLKYLCFCLPKGFVSGQWQLAKIRKREAEQEQENKKAFEALNVCHHI